MRSQFTFAEVFQADECYLLVRLDRHLNLINYLPLDQVDYGYQLGGIFETFIILNQLNSMLLIRGLSVIKLQNIYLLDAYCFYFFLIVFTLFAIISL